MLARRSLWGIPHAAEFPTRSTAQFCVSRTPQCLIMSQLINPSVIISHLKGLPGICLLPGPQLTEGASPPCSLLTTTSPVLTGSGAEALRKDSPERWHHVLTEARSKAVKYGGGKLLWTHFLEGRDRTWFSFDLKVLLRKQQKIKVPVARSGCHCPVLPRLGPLPQGQRPLRS